MPERPPGQLVLNSEHLDFMRDRVYKTMKAHPTQWWVKRYFITMKVYRWFYMIGLKSIVNHWSWNLWLYILRHAMDIWMKDGQMKEVGEYVRSTQSTD